jgi:hypothetical protein
MRCPIGEALKREIQIYLRKYNTQLTIKYVTVQVIA